MISVEKIERKNSSKLRKAMAFSSRSNETFVDTLFCKLEKEDDEWVFCDQYPHLSLHFSLPDLTDQIFPYYFDNSLFEAFPKIKTERQWSPPIPTQSPPLLEDCKHLVVKAAIKPRQTRIIVEAPTECLVCGFSTTCLHYEAASCHGLLIQDAINPNSLFLACKTFFRRCVYMRAEFVCKLKRDCDIRAGVRCRACRYDSCLRVGMRPDAINFPDQQSARVAMQVANKRKRELLSDNEEAVENVQVKVSGFFCGRV
jgi:hypothetical protein